MNSLEDQLSALGEKQRDLGDVTVTTDLDRIDRQVADQLVSMYESDQCRARDSVVSSDHELFHLIRYTLYDPISLLLRRLLATS